MQSQVNLDGNLPTHRVEHASHKSPYTKHKQSVSNLRWLKDNGNWGERKKLGKKKKNSGMYAHTPNIHCAKKRCRRDEHL